MIGADSNGHVGEGNRGDENVPSISKVFERIIFNQIHNYFHVNNLYFCSQYGFRKEHSTELAVLELIDRITQHLDKGTTPLMYTLIYQKPLIRLTITYCSTN